MPISSNSRQNVPVAAIHFSTGLKNYAAVKIIPVFLPFLGCPGKCVYCAQDRQTGAGLVPGISSVLQTAKAALERQSAACELAFYGGTFTAMPQADIKACLDFLQLMRAGGKVSCARCSTRPDALAGPALADLRRYGLELVELGVQSFSDDALRLSRRGYSGKEALEGCRAVRSAGFRLGIQLLPGMPGCTPEVFLQDVEKALQEKPSCMRFYPCLVPDGTVLAQWYREDAYKPWSLEETVSALGRALMLAWQAGVPVIRLSVAPEPAFDSEILAGPRHPALGALAQAEALLLSAEKAVARLGRTPAALELPKCCQGFIFGDKGALRKRWQALGLPPQSITFTDREDALLC
ncbi:MAG: radical SAM protein [Mailhella sp.]|nr:radical SAM protein [Mailhella sp.]